MLCRFKVAYHCILSAKSGSTQKSEISTIIEIYHFIEVMYYKRETWSYLTEYLLNFSHHVASDRIPAMQYNNEMIGQNHVCKSLHSPLVLKTNTWLAKLPPHINFDR